MKFEVTVRQSRDGCYNYICGTFFDWAKVEDFTESVVSSFPDIIIEIKVVSGEDE